MTVSQTRPAIPRPRAAGPELPQAATGLVREPAAARSPWPEPWRTTGATRPRTEYWDVATATWQPGPPAPRPRSAD